MTIEHSFQSPTQYDLLQTSKLEAANLKLRIVAEGGSITEVNDTLNDFLGEICADNPQICPFAMYQQMAAIIGKYRIPVALQFEAIRLANLDSKTEGRQVEIGRNVFLLLSTRTVFKAINDFISKDEDTNNELIQEVMLDLTEKVMTEAWIL